MYFQACSQVTQGREIGQRGTVQWQHNIAAVCTSLLTTMWSLNEGTDREQTRAGKPKMGS